MPETQKLVICHFLSLGLDQSGISKHEYTHLLTFPKVTSDVSAADRSETSGYLGRSELCLPAQN